MYHAMARMGVNASVTQPLRRFSSKVLVHLLRHTRVGPEIPIGTIRMAGKLYLRVHRYVLCLFGLFLLACLKIAYLMTLRTPTESLSLRIK
jgi:hypothetical protein